MREYKFRAWLKYKKVMIPVIGLKYLHDDSYGCVECVMPVGFIKKNIYINIKEVDLVQFTGLKDRYEKPIYEGDIIKFQWPNEDYDLAKIIFIRGCFMGNRLSKDGIDNINLSIISGKSEIIGNIYENKDLLNERV